MQRRKFIIGLGALSAGGAAAMGTGAFTSATARRTATLDTVTDGNAYLGLHDIGERSDINGNGQLVIDLGADSGNGGTGLGVNSRYAFTDIFQIANQGTNPAVVSVGVSENQVWFDRDGDGNVGGEPLIQDYPGFDIVFPYAEDGTKKNAENPGITGLGNPPAVQIDDGGRAWVVSDPTDTSTPTQGILLDPGESVNVDLSIITAETPATQADYPIYVLAGELGSDRDLTPGT